MNRLKTLMVRGTGFVAAAALASTALPISAVSAATSSKVITVGVILPVTGAASPSYTTTIQGLKARFGLANVKKTDGYTINYVVADDTSSPQGALSAAENLVQNKKVFAILDMDPFFEAAAAYTTKMGIPAITPGQDGYEYADPANKNLFPAYGSTGQNTVSSVFGKYFKSQGVTNLAVVGYGDSPSSAGSASAAAKSAKAAGIKVGYDNTSLPIGDTDIGPLVLAMKNAQVNGVWFPIESNTSFAILEGLAQNGVKLKSALLPTGYGGDLLADSSAVQAAQGDQFSTFGAPVEMKTAATKTYQAALAKYAGVTGIPTYAEYAAWQLADLFVFGLARAGAHPTDSSYIANLRKVTNYNGGGLLPGTVNFTKYGNQEEGTVANCFFAVSLKGRTFKTVGGATPVCGNVIGG